MCVCSSAFDGGFNLYGDRILILDFGSQYTKLIARYVRKLGVYCEIWDCSVTESQVSKFNPNGIILSGGPSSISKSQHSLYLPEYIFFMDVPILGICYGMQFMAFQLGGLVSSHGSKRESGFTRVTIFNDSVLINNIYDFVNDDGQFVLDVWMSHFDSVISVPEGFMLVAKTDNDSIAIMANESKKMYGLQFHPEVTHTLQGRKILKRFVVDICCCKVSWKPDYIINDRVSYIRSLVKKNDNVVLGFSGGIDSLVTALLLKKAIHNNVICIFINNGLVDFNKINRLINFINKNYNLNIVSVSAEQRFLSALAGVYDPEKKRKVVGKVFIDVFEEQINLLKNVTWLAQGTIYSDVVESANYRKSRVCTIKSHHNVGGLPGGINVKLLEPIRELFKDEVREIALILGIPYDLVYQYPLPGPGFSVRILGEVKKEYCDILCISDAIFTEELSTFGLSNKIDQAFTVFLPIRSVGVFGDSRKYDWVIALRAIKTIDFMTADWVHLPYLLLGKVSSRIINEIPCISRVVYDVSTKPPATIEWE